MVDILGLPAFLMVGIFIVAALALVFLPYFAARRFLGPEHGKDTEELASSILFRIGALHALILALVFADEQAAFIKLKTTVADEAAAIVDVFYDLERYDPEGTILIQAEVASYVATVIDLEWPLMAEGTLSRRAWAFWRSAYDAILDLYPRNPRQESLRNLMIQKMSTVADLRELRWIGTTRGLPVMFWVVALVGFMLVSLPYYVFRPRPAHIVLFTTFALYNGLALYVILDVSSPYQGFIRISPGPFQFFLPEGILQGFAG